MLQVSARGIYCSAGNFYIDPWRPVERAILTHAHSDHARTGSERYLASRESREALRLRLGSEAQVELLDWGESTQFRGVKISLHPAGHILGSAQVRLEHRGEVWVVSGDYKSEPDPTCTPFEPLRCHTFVTESTFGLPIYRWRPQREVFRDIDLWWRHNQQAERASLLLAYSLGKAQRLLAGIDTSIGPVFTHGAIEKMNAAYRNSGIGLPTTRHVATAPAETDWTQSLIVAPPSASGSPWARRFGNVSIAFASGWMQIRGSRRWRSADRGFALSDHVDWPALNEAIDATGAETVWVTHGYTDAMARWLQQRGLDARAVETRFDNRPADPGGDEAAR